MSGSISLSNDVQNDLAICFGTMGASNQFNDFTRGRRGFGEGGGASSGRTCPVDDEVHMLAAVNDGSIELAQRGLQPTRCWEECLILIESRELDSEPVEQASKLNEIRREVGSRL